MQPIRISVSVNVFGFEQKVHTMVSVHRIAIDLEKIDQCVEQLMNFDHATGYAKQKDSLKRSSRCSSVHSLAM